LRFAKRPVARRDRSDVPRSRQIEQLARIALIVCAAIGLGNEMMVVHLFSALTGTPRKK